MKIKAGSLDAFFDSARQTARAIDNNEKLTGSHTIWMEIDDLEHFLKPQRTELIALLREIPNIQLSELVEKLHRSPRSVQQDIHLLEKYQLVHVLRKKTEKIVQTTFGSEQIEFVAKI